MTTIRRIAGIVAVEVARELAEPVRALRDRLGLVVDRIERHVANSSGPAPYPWRSLTVLRQDLGATYLEATTLLRRLDELDRALADDAAGASAGWIDLAAAVDLGVRLAGPNAVAGIELHVDLANAPPVRAVTGTLALVVAQLVGVCGRSAHALAGSALSVRTYVDEDWAVLSIADNGEGASDAAEVGELVRAVVTPWGAVVEAASELGQGCAFELRLIAA